MKNFYSHIVEIESLTVELDALDLSPGQKKELAELLDSSLHHTILNAIFSELPEQDKRILLEYLVEENHDKIWEHLNSKVDNIEEKIKTAADSLKVKLRQDIEEAKKLKLKKG